LCSFIYFVLWKLPNLTRAVSQSLHALAGSHRGPNSRGEPNPLLVRANAPQYEEDDASTADEHEELGFDIEDNINEDEDDD
jgi:hypothetical protein